MELLRIETDSVDVYRSVLRDIFIEFDPDCDAYAIHFDHAFENADGDDWSSEEVAHLRRGDDEPEFEGLLEPVAGEALEKWLASANTTYQPTPKQFIENLYAEREAIMKRPVASNRFDHLINLDPETEGLLTNVDSVVVRHIMRSRIRLLISEAEESGRRQAESAPLQISEAAIMEIIGQLLQMAVDTGDKIGGVFDILDIAEKTRNIIVAGIPAVIGRKVAA